MLKKYKLALSKTPKNIYINPIMKKFDLELYRLQTFAKCKENLKISHIQLAHWGFYYLNGESSVACGFCEFVIRDKDISEDIQNAHSAASPNCSFVTEINCCDVPSKKVTTDKFLQSGTITDKSGQPDHSSQRSEVAIIMSKNAILIDSRVIHTNPAAESCIQNHKDTQEIGQQDVLSSSQCCMKKNDSVNKEDQPCIQAESPLSANQKSKNITDAPCSGELNPAETAVSSTTQQFGVSTLGEKKYREQHPVHISSSSGSVFSCIGNENIIERYSNESREKQREERRARLPTNSYDSVNSEFATRKEKYLCQECKGRLVDVLCLECEHLLYCHYCFMAKSIQKCPKCLKKMPNFIKTIYVPN